MADALRAEGIEVWYDETELRGGEVWDASIQRQIAECTLFLAIVSANTQARREGYFRLEWRLADERLRLMAEGTPFVLPVIVDGTKERDALVPKSFLGVQWTWLPHGEVPPAFVTRVQRLLNPATSASATPTSTRAAGATAPTSPATPPLVARAEIDEYSAATTLAPPATTRRRVPRSALFFAAGVLATVFVAALFVVVRGGGLGSWAGRGTSPVAGAGVARFTITLSPGQAVLSRPAISRDGRIVAFTAGTPAEEPRLYLRRLAELESQVVPGTNGARAPFFSPDGSSIAFFASGRLFRWMIGGGAPVPLADAPSPLGGTWDDDHTIVFVPVWNGGLFRLPAAGGDREAILRPDGKQDYAFVFPRFIPGRQEILFTAWGKNPGVWRLNLRTRERTKVLNGNSAMVTASGHLLAGVPDQSSDSFGHLLGLLAAPYRENASTSLAPTLVVPGVSYPAWQPDLWYSVSDTGTLAYAPADVRAKSLILVDRTGKVELFSNQPGTYSGVSVSRTARRTLAAADYRVWLYASDGTSRERLAPENRDWHEQSAKWAPDGKTVIYASNEFGNWDIQRRVPGASKSEVLLAKELDQTKAVISMDGTIAYLEEHSTTGNDIWLLEPDGKSRPWLVSPGNEGPMGFSPDGKWLAYHSNESGRSEIYVKPVASNAARIQVSTAGAFNAAWSPKGNTLFYQEAGAMWAVDLGRGNVPVLGPRRKLFECGWALSPFGNWDFSDFDVMPEDERFIMIRREPKAIPDRISVVVNWYDELRRLAPVK